MIGSTFLSKLGVRDSYFENLSGIDVAASDRESYGEDEQITADVKMYVGRTRINAWGCDRCSNGIKMGSWRYNCCECSDFDLCEKCYRKEKNDHAHGHRLQPIQVVKGIHPKHLIRATTAQTFEALFYRYGRRQAFGTRIVNQDGTLGDFEWTTYQQVGSRARDFASGLRYIFGPQKEDLIFGSICAENRLEWFLTDIAMIYQGMVSVPLGTNSSPEDHEFIINNTGVQFLVCSAKQLDRFVTLLHRILKLKTIIVMDDIPLGIYKLRFSEIAWYTFREVETIGGKHSKPIFISPPERLISVVYTRYFKLKIQVEKSS
eukprot:TRINITY_DN979_c1_g1_i2.p1 TRINITY_DN979_c1_g1~~TRINITY_DN979_c1_g1_i2.p1  ORF type:complete len:318 (+),score=74.98 TRINITY_DN979_c1_g1_i2:3-956(+)